MVVTTLQQASEQLSVFRPRRKWYRRFVNRSAVALIMRETSTGIETLMIKRSEREGDPWSGHMAFPGGRAEKIDKNSLHTATRETREEIGFDTDEHAQCLGRLSDISVPTFRGRKAMVITPYLFSVDNLPELTINYEVAEVIWVPLQYLADTNNRGTMEWKIKNIPLTLPCYDYQQYRIWGLSLMMLDELIKLTRDS
jgi:8-oxo-dGTP pyrophosphatase MutT (NUDIX family)